MGSQELQTFEARGAVNGTNVHLNNEIGSSTFCGLVIPFQKGGKQCYLSFNTPKFQP